jgi:hypothetical protein
MHPALSPTNALAPTESPSSTELPAVDLLLVCGGDQRLTLDPATGQNRYGCPPRPERGMLEYSSTTANIVTEAGYEAVQERHRELARMLRESHLQSAFDWGLARLEEDLRQWLPWPDAQDGAILPAPSGTDLHAMALALMPCGQPITVVHPEAAETGSGIPAAMSDAARETGASVDLVAVRLRGADGAQRALRDVEFDYEAAVALALAQGRQVLVVAADVSKTGLRMPSRSMVAQWQPDRAGRVRVLVDACQFRLPEDELAAWLAQGAMVAVTGSKFFGAPPFCGALLVPASAVQPQRLTLLQQSLRQPNVGLLLRWQAAMPALRAYRTLDSLTRWRTMRALVSQLRSCLAGHRDLLELRDQEPALGLSGEAMAADARSWPSGIVSFHLLRDGVPLTLDESAHLHRQLALDLSNEARSPLEVRTASRRCRIGQPVACGHSGSSPGAVLRMAVSASQVVAAQQDQGLVFIKEAGQVVDKIRWLLGREASAKHAKRTARRAILRTEPA